MVSFIASLNISTSAKEIDQIHGLKSSINALILSNKLVIKPTIINFMFLRRKYTIAISLLIT